MRAVTMLAMNRDKALSLGLRVGLWAAWGLAVVIAFVVVAALWAIPALVIATLLGGHWAIFLVVWIVPAIWITYGRLWLITWVFSALTKHGR